MFGSKTEECKGEDAKEGVVRFPKRIRKVVIEGLISFKRNRFLPGPWENRRGSDGHPRQKTPSQ